MNLGGFLLGAVVFAVGCGSAFIDARRGNRRHITPDEWRAYAEIALVSAGLTIMVGCSIDALCHG